MSADLIQTIVVGSIGSVGAGLLGMTAWGIRRMISKQDKLDLLVRGDGNGCPGIGERIRDVHQEVKHVRSEAKTAVLHAREAAVQAAAASAGLQEHIVESRGWQERIVAQEARCDLLHDGQELETE